jgi:hypothetical protein
MFPVRSLAKPGFSRGQSGSTHLPSRPLSGRQSRSPRETMKVRGSPYWNVPLR